MWLMREIKPLTLALLALLIAGLRLDAQIDRITGKNFATRSEVLARHGMVCTSVPAATQVGLDILKRGGSAVDAAIAANATLGLMEPVSNGVGGDLFAIVYSAKENKLYGINGSGRSPLGLSYDQMKAELDKAESRNHSTARDAADQRAGNGRRMGGAAQKIRQTETERRSCARDSLCRGRFSGHGTDRVLLGVRSAALQRTCPARFSKLTRSTAKAGPRRRRHLQESGARQDAAIDRRERSRRFLQRRDRRQDRRVHAGQWRFSAQNRFREAYHRHGSSRSRPTIAATMFSSCRLTDKESPLCKF